MVNLIIDRIRHLLIKACGGTKMDFYVSFVPGMLYSSSLGIMFVLVAEIVFSPIQLEMGENYPYFFDKEESLNARKN